MITPQVPTLSGNVVDHDKRIRTLELRGGSGGGGGGVGPPGPQGPPGPKGDTGDVTPAATAAASAAAASAAQAAASADMALGAGVSLWSFPGATADDKLSAALSYAAAQTVTTPPIIISPPANGSQILFSQNRDVFSGMKIINPFGFGNQQRSAQSIPVDVKFTGTGVWWNLVTPTTYDVEFSGIHFAGNSAGKFMAGGTNVLWTSVLRNVGFTSWLNILGKPSESLLMTACLIDGWVNINNSYDTAMTLGGSDNNLFMGHCLLDSPVAFIGTSNPSAYHLRLDYMQKTVIGPMFVTCEKVSGIFVRGGTLESTQLIFASGGRCEGRNKDAPAWGSNIRIDGGQMTFRDWEIFYGASNLGGTGHTGEQGVITVTGGEVFIDNCWYDRATGVDETVPWIACTGGKVIVRNARKYTKGGAWTGLPRVKQVSPGVVDADASVTVI